MAVKLNQTGYNHASSLIEAGKVDKTSAWSMSSKDENNILGDPANWEEYAKYFLCVDDSETEKTKARYKYPFGKEGKVYRSALIAIRQRAGQQSTNDIFEAAGRLLAMLDKKETKQEAKKETKQQIFYNKDEFDGIPTEIQVIPYGSYGEGEDTFVVDNEAVSMILEAFNNRENDMVIDYEHQTLEGTEAPAAGWMKKLVSKGKDGIWAAVEWTDRAKQYLENREYRYLSPVFLKRTSDNKVIELFNAALTNQPAIDGMQPVVNKISINKGGATAEEILALIEQSQNALSAAAASISELGKTLQNILGIDEGEPSIEANKDVNRFMSRLENVEKIINTTLQVISKH